MNIEEAGLSAGFILTLMVYSYLIRDNFLYRIAVYIFVGLAAAFTAIVTMESVLLPWFNITIGDVDDDLVDMGIGFIPVLLMLLLLFKTSPRLARFGNLGIAAIIGVGAAVALVGAIIGTLIPLVTATVNEGDGDNLADAIIIFIGVVSSLVYFQYLARRMPDDQIEHTRPIKAISAIGQGFIVVTLGALYAAAILTSLTIFSERVSYMLTHISGG
jgi:hypothetical protein